MLFNSFKFWIVFALVFAAYWIIPARAHWLRKLYLVVVSYALYMNWQPSFALVLFFVTLVTYVGARVIGAIDTRMAADKSGGGNSESLLLTRKRKWAGWVFALLSLMPLLIFKYYNFINGIVFAFLSRLGVHYDIPGLNWAIPVGISFFTFQALGYFFDVYRKREEPEKSFVDYLLFCSFFPQTASGPISKASELLPQIKSEKKFVFANGVQGLKWILWGIFLKCVFADSFGLYVDTVMNNYQFFSGYNCALAAILFTLQIYGDFAGYSFMAVGIAETLGFHLVNNFRRPYFAESITEFWRRWHISLTRWLTQHVYIPLGGSRCSKPRQYANIMATFLVSGLWHGANYTFLVWGGLHGIAQIGEKAAGLDPKGRHAKKKWLLRAKPLRIIITFAVVTLAWIFFRMPTLTQAWEFIVRIFTDHTLQPLMYKATNTDKLITFLAILIVFVAELRAEYLKEKTKWLESSWARWLIYISLFAMILSLGVLDAGSFIYVNF